MKVTGAIGNCDRCFSTGFCYADGNVKDERCLVVEQAIAGLLLFRELA
ncbi:MAG: hypothetical protein NHB32_06075 [Fischerella sp. CENA71]|nr:hypothetical protein [Fischerella sp. CENA71]